ncbi:mandelate racemase [Ensifer sp. Root142]|nr:mandelate racemase [Ensifer sp. Root142]
MLGQTASGLTIDIVESHIVDCPTTRRHKLSNTEIAQQSYVIVKVVLRNGSIGYGEASTLGGPRWAEESVESIKSVIDIYLAPAVISTDASAFERNALRMAAAATRNYSAKAAIESALYDAVGKSFDLPASALLGGAVRQSIEVIWALASGDPEQEIEEANSKLEQRLHRQFKIKLGFKSPEDDIRRLRRIVDALQGRASIIVDINQAWSEATALRFIPVLDEMGVRLIEQPLPANHVAAMARVAARSPIPIMVDEGAFTTADIARAGINAEGSVYSLKLVKSGGLMEMKRAAGVASSFGMELYGGCLIESGIGAAAHLAVFSTLPHLERGTEQFGPQILVQDLVCKGAEYRDFQVWCPSGPGLGITVDEEVLRQVSRSG